MRRSLTTLCLLAAAALAGCQSTGADDAPESSSRLKVQHAFGVTLVPGQAARPVALYPSQVDDALALGVTPAGAVSRSAEQGLPAYLGRRARRIALVGTVAHPDLGRIRALRPDVILAAKPSDRRLYRRLKAIAPTVGLDERVNWKPNLRQDGEALGRSDEAEGLLNRYDHLAAVARRVLRRRGAPHLPSAVRGALRRPFVASVLDDAGVPHPAPGSDRVPGARPGPYDAWTLGMGYLAATRILADLERFAGN